MLLDLSRLRGDHDRFSRSYEASAFEHKGEDYEIDGPVALALEVFKRGDQYRLAGHLSGPLRLTCGRCLESFAWPVEADFDLLYLPHTKNTGEGEVEVEEDQLAIAFYRNETIDLGQLMREQFYLALPMKPLCREDCLGLCAVCGQNLNAGSCGCQTRSDDPRFASLKALLDRETEH